MKQSNGEKPVSVKGRCINATKSFHRTSVNGDGLKCSEEFIVVV